MARRMTGTILSRIDPMVRLLAVTIALATVLPAMGAGRDIAQAISSLAIFLLFFLNGLRLSRADVLRGLGHGRFLLPLAAWCFGAMAVAGMVASHFADGWLPEEIAIGFLFLGTLASTVQSATAYSSLAGGNVAVSVVAAALLNILGVFVTAPLFALLGGFAGADVGLGALGKILALLVLPFVLGQALQGVGRPFVVKHAQVVTWMDRLAIAIAVYVAFSAAVEQGIWQALSFDQWALVSVILAALLIFAFAGAWHLAKALQLNRQMRISFMFAGAHKSVVSGAPIALILFGAERAGLILVPLLAYHLLQLIVSAPLATRLARSSYPSL